LHCPTGRLGDPGRSFVLRAGVDGAAGAVFLQTDAGAVLTWVLCNEAMLLLMCAGG